MYALGFGGSGEKVAARLVVLLLRALCCWCLLLLLCCTCAGKQEACCSNMCNTCSLLMNGFCLCLRPSGDKVRLPCGVASSTLAPLQLFRGCILP